MIFITGASKGIGLYLFNRLLMDGEDVYGTYNTTKPKDNQERYFPVQIENGKSITRWVESVKNKKDIVLINCAGVNYNSYAHKADNEEWTRVINVNLIGTFNVIKMFLPEMRANGYGRIINLSSVVGQIGIPGTSAYAASKSALAGLSKTIAVENSSKNITINNLNLGYFNIGIIRDVSEEMRKSIKEMIPSQDFGDPDEIYKAIRYLIDSNYMNGTQMNINGGLF